jgi:hypothetical protein
MSTPLKYAPITHANIKPFLHPRLGVEVNGQSAVRYLRFGRRVRVERLELPTALRDRHRARSDCTG